MALTRTLLNTHFKKAWTFTTGYKLRVVNPATSESGAGLLTVGNVLAVNTSAKYKNTTSDPSTYVVKLTVEHGVDQSRIYALDPTLYLMSSYNFTRFQETWHQQRQPLNAGPSGSVCTQNVFAFGV